MSEIFVHSESLMGTVVTIQIVANSHQVDDMRAGCQRALNWFRDVTARCSRFDSSSELSRLCTVVSQPVPASDLLFESIQFAVAVADATNGAFDPTVGAEMQRRGFDREFRSGDVVHSHSAPDVTYRDITLNADNKTVTLRAPLMLDLGAVAKGLAIDLAARELAPFTNFAIDAGGDLFFGGTNAQREPWSVGIRHPRDASAHIATLRVSDAAVCTSGDYERAGRDGEHHLVDARSGSTATLVASATVVAPSAMVADALATAAFVLGPVDGIAFLESQSVEGFIVTPALERFATRGMSIG